MLEKSLKVWNREYGSRGYLISSLSLAKWSFSRKITHEYLTRLDPDCHPKPRIRRFTRPQVLQYATKARVPSLARCVML
jgi:hypothetical protein